MAISFRYATWTLSIVALYVVSSSIAACSSSITQSDITGSTLEVQAISPLPTIDFTQTALPKSTPESDSTPTFYAPHLSPVDVQTRASSATVGPLPTAIPTPAIAKTVDLAGDLPIDKIFVCIVKRADGTLVKYLIPLEPLASAPNFVEARDAFLNLASGDVVIDDFPLAPLSPHSEPPLPSASSTNEP